MIITLTVYSFKLFYYTQRNVAHLSLKRAEQMTKVRMLGSHEEDFPLYHCALHIVILQDHVLLQAFYGKVRFRLFQLGQQHLKIELEMVLEMNNFAFNCFLFHTLPKLPFPRTLRNWKSSTSYFLYFGRFLAGQIFSRLTVSSSSSSSSGGEGSRLGRDPDPEDPPELLVLPDWD